MRRSLAVAFIAALGVAPVLALHPPPSGPEIAATDQLAQHSATLNWAHDADWFGGLSGIEVTADGQTFYAVTDRGYILRGTLKRENGVLSGVEIEDAQPLVDDKGQTREFPHTDAEGLALDAQGRLNVSFEHVHRVLRYDTWESDAAWPSYTRAWRSFFNNAGMEMVAVDAGGTLYTIPEKVAVGAYEALVYRRLPQSKWDQPFTLPLTPDFAPVGGDFGPDGKLYLLERDFTPYGFRSQVRRMTVTEAGIEDIEIILQTPLRQHGNVEGLAVWADSTGSIRLTMVSDDNFLFLLPTDLIEYVLNE
ncbi:esterase-like activity of phytase family protein [uncultured Roseobacter sp.]|uniref:esterase-like activity of phytase family protein n=1 Tax=uncultured Roseobacter sp. TaxID=114847 RepID=UPI002610BCFA|nr:esterase-like activity of phytase family protein [uncultured Roseobacter sp.]